MQSAYIVAMGGCLPNAPVDNDHMEAVLGMVGGRRSRARSTVLASNGIKTRYYAIDPATGTATHSNAQLTAAAVREAVGEDPRPTLLCCGSTSPDSIVPDHAANVHAELGWPAMETASTAGVCISGILALKRAWLSVITGDHQRAVAAGSELASNWMSAKNFNGEFEMRAEELHRKPILAFDKDFLRWMLSDGAGAFVLEAAPRKGQMSLRIDWIEQLSYAHEYPACMYAGAVKLEDGSLKSWTQFSDAELVHDSVLAVKQDIRVLERGIRDATEKSLRELMTKRGVAAADVDWLCAHYSSDHFRKQFVDVLETMFPVPIERLYSNLTDIGNVGAASMFLIVRDLLQSGRVRDGDRILCYVPESGRFSMSWMMLTAVSG